jgi:hypothetical protein
LGWERKREAIVEGSVIVQVLQKCVFSRRQNDREKEGKLKLIDRDKIKVGLIRISSIFFKFESELKERRV